MKLVAIEKDGRPEFNLGLSEIAKTVAQANLENYQRTGFLRPWCAYFAVADGTIVGSCAFKSPIHNGKVEIAYFTFPEFEGRGYATQMAACLIQIAKNEVRDVRITAQTLPEENASTKILSRLGFRKIGVVNHPEDGNVWEWELI